MNPFLAEARQLQEELVAWRRWLHAHAEAGESLPETTAFVREALTALGCEPQEVCESGLMVLLGGRRPGGCILLRADMDALPMEEASGLPFASRNGCAHACGHDMHTAMLLGAAKLLKAREGELRGTVKLMFQPAEETFSGADKMVAAGILEHPRVDAAVTLHGNSMAEGPVGTLSVHTGGAALASCDSYRIDIKGKGGHGASPEQTVDPITVGAHIHTALQELSAREIPASETVVLTQGTFHSGQAPNIIPSSARMEGTLRTCSDALRAHLLGRMEAVCTSIAQAFRARADFTVLGGCSPLYNDPEVCRAAGAYMTELLGAEGVAFKDGLAGMASEDFGNVLRLVPGLQLSLATGSVLDGANYPMHNPRVVFQEEPMYIGAAAMAYMGLRWLEDHP